MTLGAVILFLNETDVSERQQKNGIALMLR
jgi:hypothetical protein